MKNLITLLFLLARINFSTAQTVHEDSVNFYISHLNWDGAKVAASYVPKVVLNDYAQKLATMKDESVNYKLYEKICDSEKTLAIHVILTVRHQYSSKFSQEEYRLNEDSITKYQISHYTKDTLIGMIYKYNGLKWYYDITTGKSIISEHAVKYCQKYWRKKIKKIRP